MSFHRGPRIVVDTAKLILDAGTPRSYPGSGTTWSDLSGNGMSGTLINGTTYTDRYMAFDGVNDYVQVLYNSSLAPTEQITLDSWAWKSTWTGVTTSERILSKTQSGGYQLTLNEGPNVPTGNIGLVLFYGGAYRAAYVALSTISNGWNYFAGTCDGRYLKFYVNGVNVSTYDLGSIGTITYTYNNALTIGAEVGSGSTAAGQYFNGRISSIKVYNRALLPNEILKNFEALKHRFGLV